MVRSGLRPHRGSPTRAGPSAVRRCRPPSATGSRTAPAQAGPAAAGGGARPCGSPCSPGGSARPAPDPSPAAAARFSRPVGRPAHGTVGRPTAGPLRAVRSPAVGGATRPAAPDVNGASTPGRTPSSTSGQNSAPRALPPGRCGRGRRGVRRPLPPAGAPAGTHPLAAVDVDGDLPARRPVPLRSGHRPRRCHPATSRAPTTG